MDKYYSTTKSEERKRGKHLTLVERGAIQHLKKLGYSNRAIARQIGCSPSTIGYELKRGTPGYSGRGRKPGYSARQGNKVYQSNRKNCRRPQTISRNSDFLRWVTKQIKNHKWSFDTCVGTAKRNNLFPDCKIPCTKTLYNLLWKGELNITLFDLPEILSRRADKKPRIPKRQNGTIIDLRPQEVLDRNTFGHWEADTVIGKKCKGEQAIFTIAERLTGYYISIRIDEKSVSGVEFAMNRLVSMFGDKFPMVFKSITTDNGKEFQSFSKFEALGTKIYFAHPYSAWERPVNERTNRLLRRFIPKGKSINDYTDEQILMFSDTINSLPRKRLGYRSPENLFDAFLDAIYSI